MQVGMQDWPPVSMANVNVPTSVPAPRLDHSQCVCCEHPRRESSEFTEALRSKRQRQRMYLIQQ